MKKDNVLRELFGAFKENKKSTEQILKEVRQDFFGSLDGIGKFTEKDRIQDREITST